MVNEHQNARLHRRHISEKESYRWLCGYNQANDVAKLCPKTHVVMIADRESDIYDIYDAAEQVKERKADWLIRINKNRVLLDPQGKRESQKLCEHIEKLSPCQTIEFQLPKRNGEEGRQVRQELRIGRVKLHPPTGRRGRLRLSPVEATVLFAKEIDTPAGKKPIIWWLLTSCSVQQAIQPADLILWYLSRWQIEIFFRILKSSCQVESLQLTTENRTRVCLALYMIIAWRILFLTSMAKINSEQSCVNVLEYEEWVTAHISINKTKPPRKPPSLRIAIGLIAQMGGYLARKNDSPPGPKALWQGITKLYEILKFNEKSDYPRTYG